MFMVSDSPENRVTTKAYWNSIWSHVEADRLVLDESHFYYGRNGLFTKLIARHLGDIRGKSVVELGGGGLNCRLLAMARWLGAQVAAVDFSEEGLRSVANLFEANGCRATFVRQDVCEWTPMEQFDFVVHWGLLEHFKDPTPVLSKSADALKSRGRLLFSMPNMEGIGARYWKRWSPQSWGMHVFHPRALIASSLSAVGFFEPDAFFFGMPFFKITDWEERHVAQLSLDLMQKAASGSARIFPLYHRIGTKSLSMERGYCARKRA
jgi:2-polyprenyl-3-methyl-5-hydroxy-6-metoxy-1,4-benzoquinol methylase